MMLIGLLNIYLQIYYLKVSLAKLVLLNLNGIVVYFKNNILVSVGRTIAQ